jgi:hypothetical protein
VELLLVAMAMSIVFGMVFRKHERVWRVLLILLSISVTTLYFIFADALMRCKPPKEVPSPPGPLSLPWERGS